MGVAAASRSGWVRSGFISGQSISKKPVSVDSVPSKSPLIQHLAKWPLGWLTWALIRLFRKMEFLRRNITFAF